jgi:hypothetical protein
MDTLKTRMQSSSTAYRSTWDCVVQTMRNEGAMAFYRGFVPSLSTALVASGARFGLQGHFNQFSADLFVRLNKKNADSSTSAGSSISGSGNRSTVFGSIGNNGSVTSGAAEFTALPVAWRAASEAFGGAVCGLFLPILFTPMELVKVKRQALQNPPSNFAIAAKVCACVYACTRRACVVVSLGQRNRRLPPPLGKTSARC